MPIFNFFYIIAAVMTEKGKNKNGKVMKEWSKEGMKASKKVNSSKT